MCADASVGRLAKKALRSQQEEDEEEEEGVARQALRRVLPSLSLSLARAAFVQTSRDAVEFGLWTTAFSLQGDLAVALSNLSAAVESRFRVLTRLFTERR